MTTLKTMHRSAYPGWQWPASAAPTSTGELEVRRRLQPSEVLDPQCCFDFLGTFCQGRVGLIDLVDEALSPI